MHWLSRYVGIPFGSGSGQLTCWGLVRRVYAEQLSVVLPDHAEVSDRYVTAMARLRRNGATPEEVRAARSAVAEEMERGHTSENWVESQQPECFDVVLMTNIHSGRVGHVGVYVGGGRLLHTEAQTGSCIVPTNHISVSGRITGFRRYNK